MDKLEFSEMIDDFGIPLKVESIDKKVDYFEVKEPLIPYTAGSQLAKQLHSSAGGTTDDYSARWYSLHDVPLKSKVIDVQNNETYVIESKQNYLNYSDVVIYYLINDVNNRDLTAEKDEGDFNNGFI